jgi:hypothetical protein
MAIEPTFEAWEAFALNQGGFNGTSSGQSASCRYLAGQFEPIREDQGVAFSGRCGPPQPI